MTIRFISHPQTNSSINPSITMATRSVPNLTSEAAQIAAQAAQEKAKQMGIGMRSLPSANLLALVV